MSGVVDSIFGGGGGDSSSSSGAQSNNNVTVNPTTNVTIDTAPIAAALTQAGQMTADAQTSTATINATAIQAIAASMSKATEGALERVKQAQDALEKHVDGDTKSNLLIAIATAAALVAVPVFFPSKR